MTSILQMEKCLHCTGEGSQLEAAAAPLTTRTGVLVTSVPSREVGRSWLSTEIAVEMRGFAVLAF